MCCVKGVLFASGLIFQTWMRFYGLDLQCTNTSVIDMSEVTRDNFADFKKHPW